MTTYAKYNWRHRPTDSMSKEEIDRLIELSKLDTQKMQKAEIERLLKEKMEKK